MRHLLSASPSSTYQNPLAVAPLSAVLLSAAAEAATALLAAACPWAVAVPKDPIWEVGVVVEVWEETEWEEVVWEETEWEAAVWEEVVWEEVVWEEVVWEEAA